MTRIILLAAALLALACNSSSRPGTSRFTAEDHGYVGGQSLTIITDTVTGCQYLHADGYHAGAMAYMPGSCFSERRAE